MNEEESERVDVLTQDSLSQTEMQGLSEHDARALCPTHRRKRVLSVTGGTLLT